MTQKNITVRVERTGSLYIKHDLKGLFGIRVQTQPHWVDDLTRAGIIVESAHPPLVAQQLILLLESLGFNVTMEVQT